MYESAEVSYREMQFGARQPDGSVRHLRIGPALAEKWRSSGQEILQRHVTHYLPDATDWREMPSTSPSPTPNADESGAQA